MSHLIPSLAYLRIGVSVLMLAGLTTHAADPWWIDAQTVQLESLNGNTGEKTTLRLWTPPGIAKLRGVIVCGPGSNQQSSDVGLKYAQIERWQVLAQRHGFGLVGVQWTSYTGGNPLNASDPSDDLEVALQNIGTAAQHPELGVVPVALWGMSASGGYSLGYAVDRPQRCLAFIDNKGGTISAHYLLCKMNQPQQLDEFYQQAVPGVLCYDERNLYSCATDGTAHLGAPDAVADTYVSLRKDHGLITVLPDWGLSHVEYGYGQVFALSYFDRIIEARLPSDYQPGTAATLVKLAENNGWLGACNNFGYRQGGKTGTNVGSYSRSANPTVPVIIKRADFTGSEAAAFDAMTYTWLPDEYLAHLWQAASIYTHAAKVSWPDELNSNVADANYIFDTNTMATISGGAQNGYTLTGGTWFDGLTAFNQNTGTSLSTARAMTFGLHPIYAAVTTTSGTPSITGFSLLCGRRGTPTAPQFTTAAAASPRYMPPTGGSVTLTTLAVPTDGGLDRLISYTWAKHSGPGDVVFGGSNGLGVANNLTASFSVPGAYVIDVTASNAEGVASTSQVTVLVSAPPTITSSPVTTGLTDTPYTYTCQATADAAPTYTLVQAPAGMTIDHISGVITWTPTAVGDFSVTVQASNGVPSDAMQSFVITVAQKNRPPVAGNVSITTLPLGKPMLLSAKVADINGDLKTVEFRQGNQVIAAGTLNAATGRYECSWTPTTTGIHIITVVATDAMGMTSTAPIQVVVQ